MGGWVSISGTLGLLHMVWWERKGKIDWMDDGRVAGLDTFGYRYYVRTWSGFSDTDRRKITRGWRRKVGWKGRGWEGRGYLYRLRQNLRISLEG